MELNNLLRLGVEKLKDIQYSNPILESRLLLAYILEVDEVYILINGNIEIDKVDEKNFFELIELRKNGYPLQYIINNANFMGLDFYVEEGVLIPRSDTEVLVEYLLDYIDELESDDIKLLDIGIGSGAIVLSTAYFKPFIKAYGIDIEDKPIKVTKKNIEKFGLKNVELFKGDLLKPIDREEYYNYFNIIASNPPYIETDTIEELQIEIKGYEPKSALDGGADGLIFYREIAEKSKKFLSDSGLLIFEIGYNQGVEVSEILRINGFKNIKILKDIQGLDRVVLGIK